MDDPQRTSKEPNEQYTKRVARWKSWKSQEPLVDLSYVSDTEVAEYRKWAGTANWHNKIVKELVDIFKETP